jgi:carbon-monoxide dehydrogenase medium subunit
MYAFDYLRPRSLPHALALLQQHPEARPLSGGMTLIPTLKLRLASPTHLVDLTGIAELQGIARDGQRLRIGACTSHADVAASPLVRESLSGLARLAGLIADPQVRNRGTIGGSVANNDPAADYPAAVLALDATVVTSRRRIAADTFFTGLFETALEPGELVIAVEFDLSQHGTYVKLRHPSSGYAVVGVFIARRDGGMRVAVTGAGTSVFRWTEAEQALQRRFDVDALDGLRMPASKLPDDLHASERYRAQLIEVHTRRALAALLDETTAAIGERTR